MAKISTCNVQGCDSKADRPYNLTEGTGLLRRVTVVCAFHERDLSLGAPFSVDPETRELVLGGENAPLDVVRFSLRSTGVGMPVVTLHLGHDGVATQTLDLRLSAEDARMICRRIAHEQHDADH